jgi:transposase
MQPVTVGLDIAKNVFQVHAVNAAGEVVIRKRLARGQMLEFFRKLPPCLVGIEACGTAHYWSRELQALGHDVRLMPAHYVKPYIKRGKNDAADAEGICEAVTRPTMRFVAVKTPAIQALGLIHKIRLQCVGQRTAMLNAMRAGFAEFGIIATQGLRGANEILRIAAALDERVPAMLHQVYKTMAQAIRGVEARIAELDVYIAAAATVDDTCKRLSTIPGIGPVTASTIMAIAGDASRFAKGRDFAAWLGLTPLQKSTGGRTRLGRITKAGDQTLRTLFVLGALAVIKRARINPAKASPWLMGLLNRRPALVAAVALANKTARIAWAILTRGGVYRAPAAALSA